MARIGNDGGVGVLPFHGAVGARAAVKAEVARPSPQQPGRVLELAARAPVALGGGQQRGLAVSAQEMRALAPVATELAQTITALRAGDWQGALKDFGRLSALSPPVAERLAGQVLRQLSTPSFEPTLQQFGLVPASLPRVGQAFPGALTAAVGVQQHDWRGALGGLAQVYAHNPRLAEALAPMVLDTVPPQVQHALGELGLLGPALGTVSAGQARAQVADLAHVAQALSAGDWQGAADQMARLPALSPEVWGRLGERLMQTLPAPVQASLGSLGVHAQVLGSARQATPSLVGLGGACARRDGSKTLGDVMSLLRRVSPELGDSLTGGLENFLGLAPGGLDRAIANGQTVRSSLFDEHGQTNFATFGDPDQAAQVDLTGRTSPGAGDRLAQAAGQQTLVHGQASWSGSLFRAEGQVGDPHGPFFARGSVAVGEVVASAEGSLTADFQHLTFGARGSVRVGAYAVDAQGEVHLRGPGDTGVDGDGYAQVGVTAAGQGEAVFDPLHGTLDAEVDAEAFAGLRAGGELSAHLGPVSVGVSGKLELGIGAHLDAEVGLKDGKFECKFDIGAALGIGFDFGFNFSIDFKKAGEDIANFINGIPAAAGQVFHDIGQAVDSAGKAIGDAAKAVGDAVTGAVNAVGNFFSHLFG